MSAIFTNFWYIIQLPRGMISFFIPVKKVIMYDQEMSQPLSLHDLKRGRDKKNLKNKQTIT